MRLPKNLLSIANTLVISSVLILSSTVTPVYAQSIDQTTNDGRIWDKNAEDPVVCGGDDDLAGNDNMQKIFNYLRAEPRNLSENQAAGVLGNIYKESKGDPTLAQVGGNTNDPSVFGTAIGVGKAWGIIQWDAGGRAIEEAAKAGLTDPIYLLKTQLDLLWWHMENTSPTGKSNMLEHYRTIEDIADATHDFHTKIEGSSDNADELEERVTFARQLLKKYGSATTGPGAGAEDGDGTNPPQKIADLCASGANGSVVQTALNYAWPDNSPTDRRELKPEYQAAINKALANNEFTGGGVHPGVDCGGFVTRVMRDSGLDPSYNSGEGNVTAQLNYLRNSDKWQKVTDASPTTLQPGDVALRDGGNGVRHTYIFVGPNDYLENGNQVAEASYGGFGPPTLWLAPQAGFNSPYNASYEYYRFIGEKEPSGGGEIPV